MKKINNIKLDNIFVEVIGGEFVGINLVVKFGETRSALGFDINKKRITTWNLLV